MPLISLDDEDQRWVPTHVNVTVLRARALRTKGKQGSRYVYTVIQLGKQKYTTGLAEKAAEPGWNEECSLELQPGLLECVGAHPPSSGNLILTVMLRVLIGLDVFLGEAVVPLDKVFQGGTCPRNEWLKLHSKAGRKEKERGELQLTIQFTRNNMTASMYDLTIQDKPRSAFGKLRDRVTGKKRGDVESSSAILPGRYAALSSSTSQHFQEDGGGEDQVQEECSDEGKSKVKGFFLKGKLRKNSDTHSCSSLASESSMASSAGDPFVPIELCSTPVYSTRVADPFRTDSDSGVKVFTAPKVMTHKRAHSDEASKITVASRPSTAVESVKGQNILLSKSTLCINGSHVYSEPVYSKTPGNLPIKRTLLEKCSPLSRSLQNLTRRSEETQRRSSMDKSKRELEGDGEGCSALTEGFTTSVGKPVHATAPLVMASSATDVSDKGKKLRKTLFSSGRSDSLPSKTEQGQEGRMRGWFGSSDGQNKPRLGVPPKVESSPETSTSLSPCYPTVPPHSLSLVCASSHKSSCSVGPHSNPFTHPSPPPPSISPTNPFLTRLQRNPFFEDLIAEEALKSPPAINSNSTFSHYPAFPLKCGFPSTFHNTTPNKMSIKRERPRNVARQSSLPTLMSGTPETATVNSDNAVQAGHPLSKSRGEWDEFEALASSRLKSPVGTPTRPPSAPNPPSPPNSYPVESCSNKPRVDERIFNDCNLPALTSRRPVRTPLPFQERCSDGWLDRAQELAVQKEACLLFQTDLASVRHRERHRDANTKVSHLDKDMNCVILDQDVNVCLSAHTVQMHKDENLNILQNGQEKIWTEGGLKIAPTNSHYKYEHIQENSLHSASDHTVPSIPFCLSDCDTTVSESLCSDFQVQLNPESSFELKPFGNTITAEVITNPDSNNNNTNDTSEFAFIDCDSSASDVNQTTFGMIAKESNKASTQCQDLLNRKAELESIFRKEIPETDVITSEKFTNEHYEKHCENIEQHIIQPHTNFTLRVESEDPNHKESSVSPQTIPQRDRDDGSMTEKLKPKATEDNAGSDAPHEVKCCLIYDKIKTKTAELKLEANWPNVPVSESHTNTESPLTLTDCISFEDLHARVAPRGSKSPSNIEVRSARIRTRSNTNSPKTDPSAVLPTVSSEISSAKISHSDLIGHTSSSPSFSHPNATSDPSLSPLMHYPPARPGSGSTLAEASNITSSLQLQSTAKHTLTTEEAESASSRPPAEESSPHPVKPLANTAVPGEKKSVLEKLRSSIHPGRATQQTMAEPEKTQVFMSEAHTHYQTMSNMELIALLLQQEMDAERQRAESELQATLLEKREAELKKLKVQVRDLEDYIDKLLVRIMEQTPTLLQVRARPK
ncbi:uncharacterized protein LOC124386182 isoform X1 [Silurus meridionalis]|uniref:Rab11 family-interacting protein 5 n=1 Tax=Silurus meridionalis TaxID=175797 RepID=A0A8T0BMP2_SILME|nr:uncharacterized protein LOC124386182 isoform X1 [Silurus meridionalis]KAF7707513.1 hypothetical protein HF521_018731 [Silurus meridionalis]